MVRKRKKKIFQHPRVSSIQEEINLLQEESSGTEEDLEDAFAEYHAYDDEQIMESLTNDLPISDLHELLSFESGEKRETNLALLSGRKNIRQQIEKYSRELKNLQSDLFEKKVDLLLAKTKILLDALGPDISP